MMWPYYNAGWTWLWMSGMMIVFWGAIIVLAVWVIRVISRPRSAGDDSAIETLRRRLAAGEITQDEFEKTKRILQG